MIWEMTPLTWLTFFFLALLLGLVNVYSTLLTGWGDGGSIVAVILCLLFLRKNQRTIINYNLGQTMASAGGSVGFGVAIIASIYYVEMSRGAAWEPSLWKLSLLVMALSLIGVALAVPIRRYVVKWFFPSAVACATILRAVTSESPEERKRTAKIMGICGLISALFTLPTKAAFKQGAPALLTHLTIIPGLPISPDPLLYGIGMVIGPRIGLSLLLGGSIAALLLTPKLTAAGLKADDFIRWSAVGLMTLPAFTSLLFSLLFNKPHRLPPGFTPATEEVKYTLKESAVIWAIFTVALLLAIFLMNNIFQIAWYYVVAGVCIAAPACFALGKACSETDINPVRLLAIILLFFFSVFEKNNPVALLAIGISGAIFAAIAVDLFQDLRTGYLIRANPKQQVTIQFLAVIPVSFACVYFLHLLAGQFGFGEGKYFPAPGAVIWGTMAEAFSMGAQSIDPRVWAAAGIASLIGVFLTFLENWKFTSQWAPSSFALGISFLLPIDMCTAIFIGSALRFLAIKIFPSKQIEEEVFQAGSAVFAASALAGIVTIVLITLGVLYLPR